MLTDDELKKHKNLIEKVNKMSREKSEMIAVIKEKKLQGTNILKTYGFESFQDVTKLKEMLAELEEKINRESSEAEAEIIEINALREKLDSIVVS